MTRLAGFSGDFGSASILDGPKIAVNCKACRCAALLMNNQSLKALREGLDTAPY